uniref:Geissoschizine synthase n=1 Tax=Catharanthus roseus TaxID=4058 RepID=UPI0021E349B0|nr:Chain A, Geissoschizine synthase [Catharanthus roseus]8A3N_B Chain B, Geissoschizine synthase [Catharanthus roseus]
GPAGETTKLDLSVKAVGWGAADASGVLQPIKFYRRVPGERDVKIRVLYSGVCNFDMEMVRNKWGFTRYPYVFGHETAGEVVEVGSKVEKFKVGDKVAVGCMVGSCGQCYNCQSGMENYCPEPNMADGSVYREQGERSYGGCSNVMVVDEKFVLRWPENLPQDKGVALLCAGVVVYSPMKHLGLDKPGKHIGVFGLGGLGSVAVKFIKAFGGKATVISTSRRKEKEAIEEHGADAFVVNTDSEQLKALAGTMDGVVDTTPGGRTPMSLMLNLLKFDGAVMLVGAPESLFELPAAPLIMGRKKIIGSSTGGLKEYQEMLDFAAKHNIVCDTEVIGIDYLSTAMERIKNLDVKYRFAIDIGNTLKFEE